MTRAADTFWRGARTAIQVFIAAILAAGYAYLQHIDLSKGIPDLDTLKAAGAAIGLAGLSAVVAWLMNLAENHTPLPALGKTAPPAQNPVPPATPKTPSHA